MDWINELKREFFSDEDSITRYIKIRFAFACDVFQTLQWGLEGESDNLTEPIVYCVKMSTKTIYIGQSLDSQRRIKDLPIGESHHFAKSIPPELWEKIIVIRWSRILRTEEGGLDVINKVKEDLVNNDKELREKSDDKKHKKALEYIGKSLEFRLQSDLMPLFNSFRKVSKDGTILVSDNLVPSKIIKQTLPYIDKYYPKIKEHFDLIDKHSEKDLTIRKIGYKSSENFGCAVFPNYIWEKNKGTYLS
ncbi:hypothetical protein [Priestia megaterium]